MGGKVLFCSKRNAMNSTKKFFPFVYSPVWLSATFLSATLFKCDLVKKIFIKIRHFLKPF